MKNIDGFFAEVRKTEALNTDYKIGKFLNKTSQHVSNWRRRVSMPSNADVIRLCDKTGIDVGKAVRAIEYSRENERPMKEAGYADFGMLSVLGVMSLAGVSPSWGAATGAGLFGISYALYIMRSDGTLEVRLCGKVKTQLHSSPIYQIEHLIPANDAIAA